MPDQILVFNGGSSSVKLSLFQQGNHNTKTPLWSKNLSIDLLEASGQEVHELIAANLDESKIDRRFIKCVGHRVVHGGTELQKPLLVDDEVKKAIERLTELAPVHNPIALKLIAEAEKLFPHAEQIAVFDTAFHKTLTAEAYLYAVPYQWYEKFGIRRFGFHGINHQYCADAVRELVNVDDASQLVTCHLGNGCSLAAILNGKSVDTSMGFTPLEGLMMGARSGSIDPGILFYLLKQNKYSAEQLDKQLNNSSGLLGVSGISKDMQKIQEAKSKGGQRAQLAFDMFARSVSKGIASMAASMGGIKSLVFTGGIGEHSADLRSQVCEQLSFLGVELDHQLNSSCKDDGILSTSESRVKVTRLTAREDLQIFKECLNLLSKKIGI